MSVTKDSIEKITQLVQNIVLTERENEGVHTRKQVITDESLHPTVCVALLKAGLVTRVKRAVYSAKFNKASDEVIDDAVEAYHLYQQDKERKRTQKIKQQGIYETNISNRKMDDERTFPKNGTIYEQKKEESSNTITVDFISKDELLKELLPFDEALSSHDELLGRFGKDLTYLMKQIDKIHEMNKNQINGIKEFTKPKQTKVYTVKFLGIPVYNKKEVIS